MPIKTILPTLANWLDHFLDATKKVMNVLPMSTKRKKTKYAGLAQLVEYLVANEDVASSSLVSCSIINMRMC